jgi:hypothetical protein
MNINLMDHRRTRQSRQWRNTLFRCAFAAAVGVLASLLYGAWLRLQHNDWQLAWQAAQVRAHKVQSRQTEWDLRMQGWPIWEAQRTAWSSLAHESQTPMRMWHWLGTASAHGVRWTHWKQSGRRWSVSGEANDLMQVRQWVVSGEWRPRPVEREVSVSESQRLPDGRVAFSLLWEELP